MRPVQRIEKRSKRNHCHLDASVSDNLIVAQGKFGRLSLPSHQHQVQRRKDEEPGHALCCFKTGKKMKEIGSSYYKEL